MGNSWVTIFLIPTTLCHAISGRSSLNDLGRRLASSASWITTFMAASWAIQS